LLVVRLMRRSEESEKLSQDASPVMTYPIKKRINNELFVDGMTALYSVDGRIKDENVIRVVNHWNRLIRRPSIPYAKRTKLWGSDMCLSVNPAFGLNGIYLLKYRPSRGQAGQSAKGTPSGGPS